MPLGCPADFPERRVPAASEPDARDFPDRRLSAESPFGRHRGVIDFTFIDFNRGRGLRSWRVDSLSCRTVTVRGFVRFVDNSFGPIRTRSACFPMTWLWAGAGL